MTSSRLNMPITWLSLVTGNAFGETKPHSGPFKDGRLDLVYHQNPGLSIGDPFPLWTLH